MPLIKRWTIVKRNIIRSSRPRPRIEKFEFLRKAHRPRPTEISYNFSRVIIRRATRLYAGFAAARRRK